MKDWFDSNVEKKTKDVKGFNSHVAPQAYHQYQVDVGFITDKQLPNRKYKLFMIMIDVFYKYLTASPLADNKTQQIGNGIFKEF